MRAPPFRWLAVLALAMTRAFAAGAEPAPGLVTDSGGQPVRGSSGECWRASAGTAGMASACPGISRGGGEPLAAPAHGDSAATLTPSTSAPSATARPAAARTFAPASARGHPGYLTDTNGIVVRSTRGDCWQTGSWTPELATVIGCDGVLAKAMPVPAPAPSPKPQPPAESAAPPPAHAAEAAPATPPSPPEAAPSQAVPATAAPKTPPTAAAPRGRREAAPAVSPPAATAPSPAAAVPSGEAGEPAATGAKPAAPASEKVTLDTDTYFDFDKATLKPEGRRKLDALAERLSGMQLEVVVATGHTDWTGPKTYNQRLSERRALAVKHYLADKGIPRERIFTEGKGETQPAATNATRAGRAQNRRVEVEMVGTRQR